MPGGHQFRHNISLLLWYLDSLWARGSSSYTCTFKNMRRSFTPRKLLQRSYKKNWPPAAASDCSSCNWPKHRANACKPRDGRTNHVQNRDCTGYLHHPASTPSCAYLSWKIPTLSPTSFSEDVWSEHARLNPTCYPRIASPDRKKQVWQVYS